MGKEYITQERDVKLVQNCHQKTWD